MVLNQTRVAVAQKLGDVMDARAPTLWQQSLLRTMLPVSAAVLCLGPILASAIADAGVGVSAGE
jgi:hypothetical protein